MQSDSIAHLHHRFCGMASPSPSTTARLRKATAHDLEELSLVLARSFARDTSYNWVKGATHMISSANTKEPEELKALEHMRYFQWSMARLYLLAGQVDVVVTQVGGEEKIVACTCWAGPGKGQDLRLSYLLRMRLFRIWRAWGLRPFKVELIYAPVPSTWCMLMHTSVH